MTATATRFNPAHLAGLDWDRIPRHIAFIPDGNRRWAKQKLARFELGHRAGADNLIETIKGCKELGVRVVSFYLFSTENWNRSPLEITTLMGLLKEFLVNRCEEMISEGVRLNTIGDLTPFAPDVQQVIRETIQKTAHCDAIDMLMALNYGGRAEICRALQRLIDTTPADDLAHNRITESMIAQHLDTARWGDPELLIRTSGELRLSNFLLWQLSYSEIYVTDVLWPDFNAAHLLDAVVDFQQRDRRMGGGS